jgi:sugar phosphate isomerase/epimerase
MKTGVITDCFRCPLKEALGKAAALGFGGVQIYAISMISHFCAGP